MVAVAAVVGVIKGDQPQMETDWGENEWVKAAIYGRIPNQPLSLAMQHGRASKQASKQKSSQISLWCAAEAAAAEKNCALLIIAWLIWRPDRQTATEKHTVPSAEPSLREGKKIEERERQSKTERHNNKLIWTKKEEEKSKCKADEREGEKEGKHKFSSKKEEAKV